MPGRTLVITCLFFLLTTPVCFGDSGTPDKKPNFILIFCDDLGYNDLGCFDSKKIKTPHLDQMAREGKRFTSFVVPSSVCSPSRAGLLTGCYPKRCSMHKGVLFPYSKTGMHPDEYTIAEHLKSAGYKTACIGKWHLGHYLETMPLAQGFDSYYGIPYSNDMNHPQNKGRPKERRDVSWKDMDRVVKLWKTPLIQDNKIIELPVDQRTITRRYTDKAIEFITANKDKPFFLYLPHSMPHVPLFVPKDVYDPNPQNAFTCTIEHIDAEVGRLMAKIRELKLDKNTVVIFTSDNGPWLTFKNHGGSALPLRAGKFSHFEGGHRVPCIMWAPGKIKSASTCNELCSSIDLMPTFAAWAGAPLTQPKNKIDGVNILKTIVDDQPSARKEFIYYRPNGQLVGIRQGKWKLVVEPGRKKNKKNKQATPPKDLLFDLSQDISEKNNLANKNAEKVAELKKRMKSVDAEITKNARPHWKATKPHPWPDTIENQK